MMYMYDRQLKIQPLFQYDRQQLFESADVDGVGRLTHTQIKELLQSSDLGMSRIQIHAVLGNAIQDEETKTINYLEFADVEVRSKDLDGW